MAIKVACTVETSEQEATFTISTSSGRVEDFTLSKGTSSTYSPYFTTSSFWLGFDGTTWKWCYTTLNVSVVLPGDASTTSWDDFSFNYYGNVHTISGLNIHNKTAVGTKDVTDVKVCGSDGTLVKVRKIVKDGVIIYQRDVPYGGLKFTANTAGSTVKLQNGSDAPSVILLVSDDGSNWQSYSVGTVITLSNVGDYVYFKAGPSGNSEMASSMYSTDCNRFVMTGSIAASGNVMSILDATLAKTNVGYYCFCGLFYGCSSLTTPPSLPATTLTGGCCYMGMFRGCSNLEYAPELPALNVSQQSYLSMFYDCSKIENVPDLPATTVGYLGYSTMFGRCTALKGTPSIKATSISPYCFDSMFNYATAITRVNLKSGCGYDSSTHGSFATDHTITVAYS